jgi:hypothetical protein
MQKGHKMCRFFSFVTSPNTKPHEFFYFDKENRLLAPDDCDSHSHICHHFNLTEDKCNKYEYDPETKVFTVDLINNEDDDRIAAEEWVRKLDFKKIVITNKEYVESVGFKIGQTLVFGDKDQRYRSSRGWNDDMDKYLNNKYKLTLKMVNLHMKHQPMFTVRDNEDTWAFTLDMFKPNTYQ